MKSICTVINALNVNLKALCGYGFRRWGFQNVKPFNISSVRICGSKSIHLETFFIHFTSIYSRIKSRWALILNLISWEAFFPFLYLYWFPRYLHTIFSPFNFWALLKNSWTYLIKIEQSLSYSNSATSIRAWCMYRP